MVRDALDVIVAGAPLGFGAPYDQLAVPPEAWPLHVKAIGMAADAWNNQAAHHQHHT